MKPTFFADQCVPEEVVRILESAEYHVQRLRDELPIRASDDLVIAKAQQLDAS